MVDERGIGRDTELILPYGVFAFVLDKTKGHVNTLCGPIKQSLSNTDEMVTHDDETKRFVAAKTQAAAIQTNILAPKGSYVILENPAISGKQPEPGKAEVMPINSLKMGQTENLAGPQSFPLWPGQTATVVKGHHLRSNQYLLVRVYDDEAAKTNWDKSIVKGVEPTKDNVLAINKDSLVTGQIIVITGTSVAFYIPATGLEVLTDSKDSTEFVRNAVTLERLEYSILLGENGNKEFVIGPAVVFPTPTQQFFTVNGDRKFRAFELQPTSGIHVKVIADYSDGEKGSYKAGDELHITGVDMPIYYPRPEHAIISYGGVEQSFATAIPGGEGRYVLDRATGDIDLVKGPAMFLPNPITQVLVRRVLSRSECDLYYPQNIEVLRINDGLRGLDTSNDKVPGNNLPVYRSGSSLESMSTSADQSSYLSLEAAFEDTRLRTRSFASHAEPTRDIETAKSKSVVADAMNRGTKYTQPRTITLNTKYDGAVRIEVWSGFAVQVVNSEGTRRTIVGPQTVLLEYDEYLERLSLSKGKPKNSDTRMNTAFLRYISNPVSDIISLKTQDLVNVDIQVKYLVKFDEEQKDRWFSIDNYVQYMVDHLRSLIGNAVRNEGVQSFYSNAVNILRDIVLGAKDEASGDRPLRHFLENGMIVYDLELITIGVKDSDIAILLAKSRQETLTDAIELDRQKNKLILVTGQESAKRSIAVEIALTEEKADELKAKQAIRHTNAQIAIANAENETNLTRRRGDEEAAKIANTTASLYRSTHVEDDKLAQSKAEADLARQLRFMSEEADATETRMQAVQPGLIEALVAAANAGILEKVTPQLAALAFVNGQDTSTMIESLLKGTGAEALLTNLKRMSKVRATIAGA